MYYRIRGENNKDRVLDFTSYVPTYHLLFLSPVAVHQRSKIEDALSAVAADVHRNAHKRDPFNEKFVHLAQVRSMLQAPKSAQY